MPVGELVAAEPPVLTHHRTFKLGMAAGVHFGDVYHDPEIALVGGDRLAVEGHEIVAARVDWRAGFG